MRLARIGAIGAERPAAHIADDTYVDLSDVVDDFDEVFFAGGGIERIRPLVAERVERGQTRLRGGERIGSPIARPHQIICVGLNYSDHAAETGQAVPDEPILFTKSPNTLVGPNDDVRIPRGSTKPDWEVELGIVIGRRAAYLDSREQAADHIAGFVTANDVSERTFQLEVSGGQWSKGKCAPGFNPTGPWLVTPDEVDPQALRLQSRVNGEPRQDSSTADMIFPVDHIVWHLSQFLTLEPGDLVLTGTPQGVALSGRFPYLAPGDIVDIEIEGLGAQRQEFVAWEAAR